MTDLLVPLGILAMLIAWGASRHARRRKLQRQANLLGAPWSIAPVADSAIPPGLFDLAVASLGHSRRVRTVYVSNDPRAEATIVEYGFDSGFGDARRKFIVTIVARSGAPSAAPIVVTNSPLIAAAAETPGFIARAINGRYWVAEGLDAIRDISNAMPRGESPEPPDRTFEWRPNLYAAYESGPATAARVSELISFLAVCRAAVEPKTPEIDAPRQ